MVIRTPTCIFSALLVPENNRNAAVQANKPASVALSWDQEVWKRPAVIVIRIIASNRVPASEAIPFCAGELFAGDVVATLHFNTVVYFVFLQNIFESVNQLG